jgi:hypothetical protein
VKVSDVERPVDTQSFSYYWKTKLKCQKPVVKVVQDILTKKWIFVRRNKQLSNLFIPFEMRRTGVRNGRQLRDVIEMVMLLKALGIHL